MIYEPGLIFIHIPKSAGTSVASAVARGLGIAPDYGGLAERYARVTIDGTPLYTHQTEHAGHARASAVRTEGREAFDRAFTFSVVRNPWDRLVSMWRFTLEAKPTGRSPWKRLKLGLGLNREKAEQLRQRLLAGTIDDWLDACDDYRWEGWPGWTGRWFGCAWHRLPQCAWLDAPLNAVYRIEDAAEIEADLGHRLRASVRLGRENASNRDSGWRDYHTARSRRFVEDVFAPDIARFGYSF